MAKAGLSFEQLETAFKHHQFKPLYFFFGHEMFMADRLQQLLLAEALQPHERDFNLDIVYGREADARQVLSLCASYPVMAQRRVVVVRGFEDLKENRMFTAYAEQPNPAAIVLLVCNGKPNLSAHPYRALKAHAAWAEFKPLYENQMGGWLNTAVKQRGYTISPEGVQMLAEFIGTDLRRADREIEKLITHVGDRKKITGEDIVHASGQTREFNVFELQRAIGEKRFPDALRISERLLTQSANTRGEALMMVSVLTSYMTKLWKLKALRRRQLADKAMAQRVGISPFFIKEYIRSLKNFGQGTLENAFRALLAADFELKGGSTRDPQVIMTLLMRRLAAPSQ